MDQAGGKLGELELRGSWQLDSPNTHFGGFSALVPLEDGLLLAGNDAGYTLRFAAPGGTGRPFFAPLGNGGNTDKHLYDLEALTRDPDTEMLWGAFEGRNVLARYHPDLTTDARAQPESMRQWRSNSGPEAMVRLTDGRFVVLSEGATTRFGNRHPALLFSGDPVANAEDPLSFEFDGQDGYSPVDMAQLPDGRVLILLRQVRFGIPPRFDCAIAVADPAEIEAGGLWQSRIIARLDDPAPRENYEGLAIVPQAAGDPAIWVISDDNFGQFQRTLLLQLGWPTETPDGSAATESDATE